MGVPDGMGESGPFVEMKIDEKQQERIFGMQRRNGFMVATFNHHRKTQFYSRVFFMAATLILGLGLWYQFGVSIACYVVSGILIIASIGIVSIPRTRLLAKLQAHDFEGTVTEEEFRHF